MRVLLVIVEGILHAAVMRKGYCKVCWWLFVRVLLVVVAGILRAAVMRNRYCEICLVHACLDPEVHDPGFKKILITP